MAVVSFTSYKSYRLNQNSSSDNSGGDLREKHSNTIFDILENKNNKIVSMVICTFQLNLVIVEINYISSNLLIYNMVSFVIHRSFIVP